MGSNFSANFFDTLFRQTSEEKNFFRELLCRRLFATNPILSTQRIPHSRDVDFIFTNFRAAGRGFQVRGFPGGGPLGPEPYRGCTAVGGGLPRRRRHLQAGAEPGPPGSTRPHNGHEHLDLGSARGCVRLRVELRRETFGEGRLRGVTPSPPKERKTPVYFDHRV